MESTLANIRIHIDTITLSLDPSTSKRARGGKLERAKAVAAIQDAVSQKSAVAALNASSKLEMVRGPQEDPSIIPPLGWAELGAIILDALNNACLEALASKKVSKSGVPTFRQEYITCFRAVLKLGLANGPPAVFRGLVSPLLWHANAWLSEPPLRMLLADHIWQCVRDILQPPDNRAMLIPAYIRKWVDVCFQQLTARGPLRHDSQIATNLAGEVLQTLASATPSYDTLTQSKKGISATKMLGGDFDYAVICERCCLMLVVAESFSRREARELQAVAFRTLTIALTDHALDVLGSSALKSIINVSLTPIISCWTDRRYHDPAVSIARILLMLAPNDKSLKRTVRQRVQSDLKTTTTTTASHVGKDVHDNFIDVTASCFSFRESLEFASSLEAGQIYVVIWLRVAYAIISKRILKKGTTLLVDVPDVIEQCGKSAETVTTVLQASETASASSYDDVVRWSCKMIQLTASLANRIHVEIKAAAPSISAPWQKLYVTLRDQLTKVKNMIRSRGRAYGNYGDDLQTDELLIQTLSLLSTLDILENSTLEYMPTSTGSQGELPYPLSKFCSPESTPSHFEVEYFRNLTARNGMGDGERVHLRSRAVRSLTDFCLNMSISSSLLSKVLVDSSSIALGLVYGECELSVLTSSACHVRNCSTPISLKALSYFQSLYAFTEGDDTILGDGAVLVNKVIEQEKVWGSQMDSFKSIESKSLDSLDPLVPHLVPWSTRTKSNATILKHESVDFLHSEAMENYIVSAIQANLGGILSMKAPNEQNMNLGDEFEEDQTPSRQSEPRGLSDEELRKVSRVLLFTSNYLLQGLQLALFSRNQESEHHPHEKLGEIVGQLLARLAVTDSTFLVSRFQTTAEMLRVTFQLSRFMTSSNDSLSVNELQSGGPWAKLSAVLSSTTVELMNGLSEKMMSMIVSNAKENIAVVRKYSSSNIEEIAGHRGTSSRRRKKQEKALTPARKKRRTSSFATSRSLTYGSDKDEWDNQGSDQPDSEGGIAKSDSDTSDLDNFGHETLDQKSDAKGFTSQPSDSSTRNNAEFVAKTAALLRICVTELPTLAENLVELCGKEMESLDQSERMLSPDGFERHALMSNIINPFYLEFRMSVWNLMIYIGSSSSLTVAGRDILKLGKLWKQREEISFSYASFYVQLLDTGTRKYYPMTTHLERLRIAFLEYARMVAESLRQEGRNLSVENDQIQRPSQTGIRHLVCGMIEIADYFRQKHAFRMPVRARISYLRFGISAIDLFRAGVPETTIQSQNSSGEPSIIQTALIATRSAIFKSLGDSEAIVRIVAANVIPQLFATNPHPLSQAERFLQDNIPHDSACIDSLCFYGSSKTPNTVEEREDEVTGPTDCEFSESEQLAASTIFSSFRHIGARAKACAAFIALSNVANVRIDLLPYCVLELLFRVSKRAGNVSAAYLILVRLCASLGHPSPRYLFKSYSRMLLPKWFGSSDAIDRLYMFPASLVIDSNHYRDGVLFDWMRDNQGDLIPHLLVREKPPALEYTLKFSETLGLELKEMLANNIASISLVFPMQFIGSLHENGRLLWRAIDSILENQSMTLMYKHKIDVVNNFLQSAAAGCYGKNEWDNRAFDVNSTLGFSRDTRQLKPPLYDPLIIASAINQLFGSNPNIFIVPRSVLHGSLFAEVCDERSGNVIVDNYTAFLEECQRGSTSLLRILITITRFLVGPPNPQPPQNRLDAFFCVGMIWRMAGMNLLSKSYNERVLFYKLIAKGFQYSETVHDAAWLLMDVQRRVLSMYRDRPDIKARLSDLNMEESKREHLSCLASTREIHMYELLSTVSPILVPIAADVDPTIYSTLLQEAALSGLRDILQLCANEHLWSTISANGPFPQTKSLKSCRKIYQMARAALQHAEARDQVGTIFATFQHFKGAHNLSAHSLTPMTVLSSLQEMRDLLSEENVERLSRQIAGNAWRRSNGLEHSTSSLLGDVIRCLIGLIRKNIGSATTEKCQRLESQHSIDLPSRTSSRDTFLRSEILHEAAEVLSIIGLLHAQLMDFSSRESHERPIPARYICQYENTNSGTKLAFLLLMELLRGSSPVASECALNSFISILGTADGKAVFVKEKENLDAISQFRVAARKLTVSRIPTSASIIYDVSHGEEVDINTFPDLIDSELWEDDCESTPSGNAYERWMCRFCAVASTRCRSPALQTLTAACYISSQFSTSILPYLLMDIVQNADEDTIARVSSLLRQHVLQYTNIANPILRAFVHALDVLCQVGLAIIDAKGMKEWFNSRSFPVLRYQYVLDIPYVEVARAALKCGAYFSAIRYAQMHVNHIVLQVGLLNKEKGTTSRRAERRNSSCPSNDPSIGKAEEIGKGEVWNVMRDAMMRINEPDGMRAFGNRENLREGAATMANLDGDWSKSLGALDIVTRFSPCTGRTGSGLQSENPTLRPNPTHGVDLGREVRVVQSLFGLGTLSLLTDYWTGLCSRVSRCGVGHGSTEDELYSTKTSLNDLRYAAAWKLGMWESPPLLTIEDTAASHDVGGVQSFHEAVFRGLRYFRDGKFAEIPDLLGKARIGELRHFCNLRNGEYGSTVFQTVAKLRVISVLEDFCLQLDSQRLEQLSSTQVDGRKNSDHGSIHAALRSRQKAGINSQSLNQSSMLASPDPSNSTLSVGETLATFYNLHGSEGNEAIRTFQNAFDELILTEDLPISLLQCLSSRVCLPRIAATISSRVLATGSTGSWSRAASCLGTAESVSLADASSADQVAWKLQEARLRWSSSHDARSRKQALAAIIDTISQDLGGQNRELESSHPISQASEQTGYIWHGRDKTSMQHAFLRSEACQLAALWSLNMQTDEPMNLFNRFLKSGLEAVERKSKKYDQMVSAVHEMEAKIEKLKDMKTKARDQSKEPTKRRSSRASRSQASSSRSGEKQTQIGKDLDSYIREEQKKVAEDRSRLEKLNKTYQQWQLLACQHFAACLSSGSVQELRAAFRMVALWLDSGKMRDTITLSLVANDRNQSSNQDGVRVPVSKLLPLAPQLTSRLSKLGRSHREIFQEALAITIQRMAQEYPAHCLWQLLALSNATRGAANKERLASLYKGDKDKKDAADEIIKKLYASHGESLSQMVEVANSYIQLSEIPLKQKSNSPSSKWDIRASALCKLGEQQHVPVPTVPLPLSGTNFSHDLPYIMGFEQQATICNGLSRPLKITCIGSDGKRYAQMVKGTDDLRGDAVMEQLFAILNSLLEKDANASRRSLIVRTYRIIPLSPFSGIMQFVSNTVQFRELLVDNGKKTATQAPKLSLHERYHPSDMKHGAIWPKMCEWKDARYIPKRVELLRKIWHRIRPAFRYFFLEQWPDPAEWFAHQLAYSRSVAVMSIVGFILGLGDRHLSNILVDVFTAEVVHIDFGICFEKGKLLGTPELMPFRLTRDVVDGFGIAGVEGVFRRCCEVTLSVMRSNKDVLLTVVEVLLHDPMFNWDLTPEEVLGENRIGRDESDQDMFGSEDMGELAIDAVVDGVMQRVSKNKNGSKEAQRALHRISEKLDGLEGTERLSVEAHVARLIDEARAFHVLAPVFPGWMPWL